MELPVHWVLYVSTCAQNRESLLWAVQYMDTASGVLIGLASLFLICGNITMMGWYILSGRACCAPGLSSGPSLWNYLVWYLVRISATSWENAVGLAVVLRRFVCLVSSP
jgi:hypothetical protein